MGKKEKKKEKREKEKEKKPDEPSLFTPVQLKIKPPAPPTESKISPDPTPVATPQTTPKLVIKNLPKEKDKDKETESVPMLGFQPLRTGPARTPKAAAATAASAPSPAPANLVRRENRLDLLQGDLPQKPLVQHLNLRDPRPRHQLPPLVPVRRKRER